MFQFELFSTDYNSRYITLEEEEDFDDDDDIDFDSYEYELSGLERSNRTPSSINNTNLLKKEKPKIFVVYVNEKKYYFDQNLLMMASDVISKFCQENPGCQKYHFDFNDECNIMKKIENLFQFKFETFLISEKMAMENIIGAFRFNCFDILTNNINGPISFPMKLQMPAWIYKEIKNNSLQQLKIQTLKKVYKCKTYGILSSTTIKAFFNENPEVDTFCYEFKDDNHEFQLISDYLNLGTIMINPSNMNLVYDIATELQISSLLKKVEKFVNKLEAQRKIIEENFSIVEPVEQLFDLLKNINSMEIIEITHQILLSIWPYSKDNIREMVSCFSVFIEHNMPIHKKILQLCIALDNEKRESNYLHLFIPFLSDNLLHSFYSDFAFLYLLMNHGFVSVQSIKLHFESCFPRTWQYIHWVLPELLESYVPTWKSNLGNDDNSLFITFIKQLYKEGKEDNFDKFKQMRNSGDVPDPIFEVIKNDKIDTLQLIFSQSKESLNSEVPFNLFEKNQKLTLINYAAFYGSVKCFNFLFLNHADISQKTLAYAISNGNIEIIRTIYQHLESLDIHDCLDGLLQSVANHENDIFDWLFDEYKRKNPDFTFRRLISSAVKNNNSHVLIKCIEEGCELEYFSNYFISEIARKGCLKLYKFILKLCPKIYFDTQYEIKSYVQTDSLEIFTLFLDNCHNFGNVDIVEALKSSVKTHSFDIMRFICEKWKNNLYDYFELNPKDVDLLICSALGNNDNSNTDDAIIYLVDFLCDYEFDQSFIIACGNDKIEIVKYMCKLLLQKNPKYNFTSSLIESGIGCAERVLKFLIQNIELVYDFEEVLSKSKEILSNGNENTLSLFMTIFTEEQKRLFLYDFGYHAIQSQNPELINFIINQNYNLQNALFSAIFYNSLDTVKLIIDKNNSPNFINGLTNHGTAITYAVLLNRIEIVKFLLTMPNINLIYSNPLETAIVQSNPEMTSILLHFCDKNINPYLPQINRSIQNMAKKIKKNSEAANNESNDLLSNNDILILKMLVKIKNIEINILINEKSFLQIACSMNHEELVSILLSCENIDVNCFNFLFLTTELDNYLHCIPYETSPLNIALKNHNNIIVELLLKHPQIEVNCSLAREGTPLMIAIENKNFIGVDLLLKHPDIDVNVGNENSTPLEEVIHLKQVNIIEMIINHKSFHPDENALFKAYSLCLILGMEEIAAQIFECPQFDINRIGKIHEINSLLLNNEYNCLSRKEVTPLIIAVITFNDLNIQKIIHHPKFDPNKSLIHLAIENSIEIDDVDIFRMLIPYCTSSLKSFLIYAAKTCSNNIIQYLWSESYNNDIQEEDIISAFLSSSHLNTLKLIYRLHPIDLSKPPPSPFKSYFQIIFKPENVIRSSNEVRSLVEFLIENGADPNSDLGNGLTPLAKAIINMKEETVEALLSFPQIDLNKRLEPTNHTYLHLAAQSSKTILSQILDINVIDVNSEDNNGETPLFYAVRKNIRENVDLLFQNPKLDYKKRNHQNFTVLEYSKPKYHKDDERYSFYSFSQRYTPITIPDDKEKNKYLQTIIHKLNAISRKISY